MSNLVSLWSTPSTQNCSYQIMLHDITGCVDEALVLRHEEDGAQVAREAEGQDEGGDGPHPQAQHPSRSQHTCNRNDAATYCC
jgi:hypothetical protein